MKYSIFIVCLCFFIACENNSPEEQSEEITQEQDETIKAAESQKGGANLSQGPGNNEKAEKESPAPNQVKNMYQEKLSDNNVSFDVMCRNGETSKYQILGTGFGREGVKFNGVVEGQLLESFLLDLDNDGYSEIYLVFNLTDDSGNKIIKGFSSYSDKSAGEIYVKDTKEVRQMNTDQVFVENKKLMRSFKNEKGENIEFEYALAKDESSFVLSPKLMVNN